MTRFIYTLGVAIAALAVHTACSLQAEEHADTDQFRVIDGDPAPDSVSKYAAVVALHSRSGDTIAASPFCSGSLISPDVVMTAAHCCDNAKGRVKVKPAPPEEIAIYFGEGPAFSGNTLNGEIYAVSELRVHPDYSPLSFTNDICLIRLDAPNQGAPTVPHLPASLGLSNDDAGVLLDHVGFGYSDLDKTEFGVRLHAEVPFAGLGCVVDGCPGPATDKQFSYVQDGDPYTGTCNGDSGGPNMIERNGKTYVAGITSYGDAGCDLYGVSTNVSSYQSFIDAFVSGSTAVDSSSCGNDVCDFGESCDGRNGSSNCPGDCPGESKGKPSSRYCFVDGACEGPGC